MPSGDASCRVGVDENGLGARLGPLVVTAVLAEASAAGQSVFTRPLRGKIREDLGDSKRLVSHADVTLGEAWARVLTGDAWATPQALFEASLSSRKRSTYHFAGIGEVNFVQDADASDPLVMLASLVGKYVRELLMGRISRFHGAAEHKVSGYHDPRTTHWVEETRERRRSLRIVDECFERARDTAS